MTGKNLFQGKDYKEAYGEDIVIAFFGFVRWITLSTTQPRAKKGITYTRWWIWNSNTKSMQQRWPEVREEASQEGRLELAASILVVMAKRVLEGEREGGM